MPTCLRRCAYLYCTVLVLAIVSAAACSGPGSEFLGKWVDTKNADIKMEITRNGEQFLIIAGGEKVGAIYKDGGLEVSGAMGSVRITHVRDSDTLIVPGLSRPREYKRDK